METKIFAKDLKNVFEEENHGKRVKKYINLCVEATQHYTNRILSVLNPIPQADEPFVICALLGLANALSAQNPQAKFLADQISQTFGSVASSVPIKENRPD